MSWVTSSNGFRLDPIAAGPPEALVVLLQDDDMAADSPFTVVARWAPTVPSTAFVVLDGRHAKLDALIEEQLRSYRLSLGQLVLVGFGQGGALALHFGLDRCAGCAGVLAIAPRPLSPVSRIASAEPKVRLIARAEDDGIDHRILRDVVALLTACSVDARGVLLAGSILSDEVIRHGGAYLVELVATAQRASLRRASRDRRRAAARLSFSPE
jgi:pimeloyl-ACP methyl ester carboxylesterase